MRRQGGHPPGSVCGPEADPTVAVDTLCRPSVLGGQPALIAPPRPLREMAGLELAPETVTFPVEPDPFEDGVRQEQRFGEAACLVELDVDDVVAPRGLLELYGDRIPS